MNWKKLATDKLRLYLPMKTSLENLDQEIRQTKSPSYALALEEKRKATRCWVETVERGLSALTEDQRYVLWEMYIDPKPQRLDRLCTRFHVEQAQIYRRREAALDRFTAASFGAPPDA